MAVQKKPWHQRRPGAWNAWLFQHIYWTDCPLNASLKSLQTNRERREHGYKYKGWFVPRLPQVAGERHG